MPAERASRTRARRWFVTIDCAAEAAALAAVGNDYVQLLRNMQELHSADVTYVTGVQEVGHENGRSHIHAYLSLSSQMDLTRVKSLLGLKTAHFDIARGTLEQARRYMLKDVPEGIPLVEFGVAPRDGGRDRPNVEPTLPAVAAAIDDGTITTLREVPTEIRIRFQSQLHQMLPDDDFCEIMPRVVFQFGPAGCGKTHLVYELYDRRFVAAVTRGNCGLWIRGDMSAPIILYDEATDARMDMQTLNLLVDGNALLEQKGKQQAGTYSTLFINTNQGVDINLDPQAWYASFPPSLRQTFLRRIGFGPRARGQAPMALFVNWEDRLAADRIAHPADDEGVCLDRVRAQVRQDVEVFVSQPIVIEHRGARPNPGLAQLGLVAPVVAAAPNSPPRQHPVAGPSAPSSPDRHRPHVAPAARPSPQGTPLIAALADPAPASLRRADADIDIAAIEADAQPRDADGFPLYDPFDTFDLDTEAGRLAAARHEAGIDPALLEEHDLDVAMSQ